MEIYDLMESCYRRERKDFKRRVQHDFIMCSVLTRFMFREDKDDIPHPWEYYPELFAAEETDYSVKREQEEFESAKQRRRQGFEEYNRRMRMKGEEYGR